MSPVLTFNLYFINFASEKRMKLFLLPLLAYLSDSSITDTQLLCFHLHFGGHQAGHFQQ